MQRGTLYSFHPKSIHRTADARAMLLDIWSRLYLMHIGETSMRPTIAFVLLLMATVFWAGCSTTDNSNTAGNANMAATPANANTGKANTNNANVGNVNMSNMNMSNMNMGKPNKKANANKTP